MAGFQVALRIARRDALRNRWRSLLVLALIGLPVLILTVADVAWRTYQLSDAQKLDREIGTADIGVQDQGAGNRVQQAPDAWLDDFGYGTEGSGDPNGSHRTTSKLLAALPAGSRAIVQAWGPELQIRTGSGIAYAQIAGLDYRDPLASPLVTQESGRAPQRPGEVALTTQLAQDTGLTAGDTLHTVDGSSFAVVGVVHDSHNRRDSYAYALPATIRASAGLGLPQTWLVDTPAPITWPQVLKLNDEGWLALSRQAMLHPPPRSEVPFLLSNVDTSRVNTQVVGATSLIAGMALLEVVLLAGPAFAVGAKRQRRDLALVAVAGGPRSTLRNIVLANGLVLGLSAGVVGIALGVAVARIALPLVHLDQYPGPFDLRPLELGGLLLVGLLTALLAALVPARAAARADVLAALAGRRGEPRIRRRVPVFGVAVVGAGIALAAAGTGAGRNVNLILAGVATTEIGLIICTPTLITLIALLGRRLPLGPRLALRDAARNRSAAAPAVASIMAATIGAVAIAIVANSQIDHDRRQYIPSLPGHLAFVGLSGTDGSAPVAAVTAALRKNLEVGGTFTVHSPVDFKHECSTGCTVTDLGLSDPTANDPGPGWNGGGEFGQFVVDDGSAVSALFGGSVPEAEAALRAGKAVVPDATLLVGGGLPVWRQTVTLGPNGDEPGNAPPPAVRIALPAVAVSAASSATPIVLPPSLAKRLTGDDPTPMAVIAPLTRNPSTAQRQALNSALLDIDPNLRMDLEHGFRSDLQWALYGLVAAAGLIALGAAAVATALANTDGRPDLVTLGAVGASPRTRRTLTMSRAGVIALLGCVIGAAAGFVPAVAWIRRQAASNASWGDTTLYVVVPWHLVVIAALGVPLVATLTAGLFSRSRLPSERRVE